jgi:hypothetical protein
MQACSSPANDRHEHSEEATRPKLKEIFRAHANEYLASDNRSSHEMLTMRDILRCRTAQLGGYLEKCGSCGHAEYRYNSCSNRNCPSCQWLRQVQWGIRQTIGFLPVAHHQVVMTLPGNLRGLARVNKKLVHTLMMRVASETVAELVRQRYGAIVGQVVVLHTWNRELGYHPHVHQVVSCGGLAVDGQHWVSISRDFLVSIEDMRSTFRSKLVETLIDAYHHKKLNLPATLKIPGSFCRLMRLSSAERWIVWVEAPIGMSSPIVKYLSQYVNRIGISNSRLISFESGKVTFETRDGLSLTLGGAEFIERYMQHIVPKGFHKVRHYGLYSPKSRKADLGHARSLVPQHERVIVETATTDDDAPEPWQELMTRLTGRDPRCCPKCGELIERTPFGPSRFGCRPSVLASLPSKTYEAPAANTA